MSEPNLSAEDLAELERLYDNRMRYVRAGIASSSSIRALGRLSNALIRDCPRLLAMIKEAVWERDYYKGMLDGYDGRAEQAEAERDRLRAGRCQHGIPIGDLCDGISKRDEELERLRAALGRVEKALARLDERFDDLTLMGYDGIADGVNEGRFEVRTALAGDVSDGGDS